MLHTPPNSTTHVILSTTERDLITGSPYDVLYRPGYSRGSLHYIDPAAMELLTYRALTEVHPPQEYEGFLQVTPLTHALVRPRTGKFVHPGEHKRLTDYGRELKRVEQERRARGLDRFGNTCTTEPRRSDPAGTSGRAGPPPELARPPPQEEAEPFHEAFADPESMKIQDGIRQRYERLQRLRTEDTNSDDTPEGARMKDRDTREGICEICHRKTRDWVVFDHGTGTCKCRTCLGQPGRSRPTDAKDEMPHG
jgi:hypothetical protein